MLMKKDTWKFIIQTVIAILTAIATTLGVTACMGSREFLAENHAKWDAENGLLRHDDRITKSSPDGVTYDLIDDDSQSW